MILSLLLLCSLILPSDAPFIPHIPEEHVSTSLHGSVTLPCNFSFIQSLEGLTVIWKKEENGTKRIVYWILKGQENLEEQDPRYRGRVNISTEFPQGNLNLILRDVTYEDAGTYYCQAANKHRDGDKKVTLSIDDAPFIPRIPEEHVSTSLHGSVPLPCNFSFIQSLEGLSVIWEKEENGTKQIVYWIHKGQENLEEQDPRYRGRVKMSTEFSQGNLDLILRDVTYEDEGTYYCRAANKHRDGDKKVTLSIDGNEEKEELNIPFTIMRTMSIIITITTITCLVLLYKHNMRFRSQCDKIRQKINKKPPPEVLMSITHSLLSREDLRIGKDDNTAMMYIRQNNNNLRLDSPSACESPPDDTSITQGLLSKEDSEIGKDDKAAMMEIPQKNFSIPVLIGPSACEPPPDDISITQDLLSKEDSKIGKDEKTAMMEIPQNNSISVLISPSACEPPSDETSITHDLLSKEDSEIGKDEKAAMMEIPQNNSISVLISPSTCDL